MQPAAYTRLKKYSDSSQFKRFELSHDSLAKTVALNFSSMIFSIVSGTTVLIYGMIFFNIHERANFNYGIYMILIVVMSILAVALRSFLRSFLRLFGEKIEIEDYIVTLLGFVSGIYLINYSEFMLNYNPLTMSKYLLITEGYNMSLIDVPFNKGLNDILIISAILTAAFILGSYILRRVKHD